MNYQQHVSQVQDLLRKKGDESIYDCLLRVEREFDGCPERSASDNTTPGHSDGHPVILTDLKKFHGRNVERGIVVLGGHVLLEGRSDALILYRQCMLSLAMLMHRCSVWSPDIWVAVINGTLYVGATKDILEWRARKTTKESKSVREWIIKRNQRGCQRESPHDQSYFEEVAALATYKPLLDWYCLAQVIHWLPGKPLRLPLTPVYFDNDSQKRDSLAFYLDRARYMLTCWPDSTSQDVLRLIRLAFVNLPPSDTSNHSLIHSLSLCELLMDALQQNATTADVECFSRLLLDKDRSSLERGCLRLALEYKIWSATGVLSRVVKINPDMGALYDLFICTFERQVYIVNKYFQPSCRYPITKNCFVYEYQSGLFCCQKASPDWESFRDVLGEWLNIPQEILLARFCSGLSPIGRTDLEIPLDVFTEHVQPFIVKGYSWPEGFLEAVESQKDNIYNPLL